MGIYDDSVQIFTPDDHARVKENLERNKSLLEMQTKKLQGEGLTEDQIKLVVAPIEYAIALAEQSIRAFARYEEPNDNVIISKSVYLELLNDSNKLACLESGGVDNWDWYSDSLEEHREVVGCDRLGESLEYE